MSEEILSALVQMEYVTSSGANPITLDSGTTGTVNIGTGNNSKTINIGTGSGGNTINIATDNTLADTIIIGSALDTTTINGSVTTNFRQIMSHYQSTAGSTT